MKSACLSNVLTCSLAAMIAISTGCGQPIEVVEVSVADSGIEITDVNLDSLQNQWPQWRGPRGDGIAADQSPPTTWDADTNVVWQTDLPGRGHSSPIVVDEKIFLATAVEDQAQQIVLAFDFQSGEKIWQTIVHQGNFPSDREIHQKATNANTTLACDGETLVTTQFNDGQIFATGLDLDGNEIWQTNLGGFASRFGYAPSPIIYRSLAIIASDHDGGDGGFIVALDTKTGDVAWRRKRGAFNSYSSPMIAQLGGVEQLLITGGGQMTSYDPGDGEIRWETECIAEATCGTVVTSNDRIFASGGYPDNETVCISGDGQRIWDDRTRVYEPSMITDGKSLFAVDDDGIAFCWSVDDGQERWKKRLGGRFSASPVLCNGLIYAADLTGKCYVFRADGEKYDEVAVNEIGDDCYASPAVVDDSFLFRIGFGDGDQRRERLVRIADLSASDSPTTDSPTTDSSGN